MQGAYERPRDDANGASPREDTVLTMQLQAAPRAGGGGGAAHAGPWATVRRVGPRWWAITRLWFTSEERWRARGYAGAAVGLSVLTALLLLKVSYVQNSFQSALSEKNQDEFRVAVRQFIYVIIAAAPLFAAAQYVEGRVVVEWRRWLAERLLAAYFADHAYYKLKLGGGNGDLLDNPDQRICDDVRSFAASSVALAVGVIRKLLYCFMFGGLLFSIAPNLLAYLLAYALLGTYVTTAGFGRRLMHLTYALLQREADLRFALVRVRENAESIAFYSGDRHESATADTRLARAVATAKRRLWWEAWLGAWTNAYSYATILAPALLMAPRYFAGEVRFGDISQTAYAFHRIEEALNYMVNNLSEFSGLAAQTERLEALLSALRAPGATAAALGLGPGVRVVAGGAKDGGLHIEGLTLFTPGGEQVLVRDLDLSLSPGQSLLIVGPSGCGKSSILRAAAGLWSLGSGLISSPPPGRVFFLPQKPYMTLGSLRQQLLFPSSTLAGPAAGGGGGKGRQGGEGKGKGGPGAEAGPLMVPDAELERLLKVVRLPDLAARVGGLGAECDWSHVLSLGEQQRVAMLRLLTHAPALAFLDEATSAVDAGVEKALYEALQACCPCYVSIGHRMQLADYHTHVLECQGEGRWVLQDAREFRRRLQ